MALSFLGKWFGGKRDEAPQVEEVRAELDRLIAARPAFAAPMRWLRDLLPDLTPITDLPTVDLTLTDAHAKLAAGIPLLRGEDIAVAGRKGVRNLFLNCGLKKVPDAFSEAILAGRPEELFQQAEALGLDPMLEATLLRFTLFPVLTALSARLAPLRECVVWERGYCPTCGNWPLLGEYRGLDQARYLRCGWCADGWEAARLWCPFCGERDHERLSFFHAQSEENQYRAAVCETCRGYVKTISTLSALPPLHLLAADAATLHLDLAAAERGYSL